MLTRARQGMILFVPRGEAEDPTRLAVFYDQTFEFLQACGVPVLTVGSNNQDIGQHQPV